MKKKFGDNWENEFLDRIVSGRSVGSICRDSDMPAKETFYKRLMASEDLSNRYARACLIRADHQFEEIIDIADDAEKDLVDGEVNHENIQRARLRIDARKWTTAKMNPTKYSDKVDMNVKADMNVTINGDDADV